MVKNSKDSETVCGLQPQMVVTGGMVCGAVVTMVVMGLSRHFGYVAVDPLSDGLPPCSPKLLGSAPALRDELKGFPARMLTLSHRLANANRSSHPRLGTTNRTLHQTSIRSQAASNASRLRSSGNGSAVPGVYNSSNRTVNPARAAVSDVLEHIFVMQRVEREARVLLRCGGGAKALGDMAYRLDNLHRSLYRLHMRARNKHLALFHRHRRTNRFSSIPMRAGHRNTATEPLVQRAARLSHKGEVLS